MSAELRPPRKNHELEDPGAHELGKGQDACRLCGTVADVHWKTLQTASNSSMHQKAKEPLADLANIRQFPSLE